ncbi:GTP cyclohydrolase I [Lusitaniella coriacea LEGE 07157]|uniref:GTP cyclohydrolase I n=1 Tax=Lusitaniella coriacea LEGE 07157 TaxID=945747 RepID=A0A8J7E319_9CYAN|nr:GTP cyclohydrolase I [Lusitaniella coriacea]MBE9118916.1 GTP cyclohydrolase I [Lusitaniella coriacea LEGE 07157]
MSIDENHPEFNLLRWLSSMIPSQEIVGLEKSLSSKPGRITDAYRELFKSYEIENPQKLITVTEDLKGEFYHGLVSGLEIPFLSFCEHHFLPFFGTVDLVYEPGEYIIGIGKLSRLVDYRTKRFNIQERIAEELCSDLMKFALAKGAFARVKAQHLCLCHRGPKKYSSFNTVCYWSGSLLEASKKQEIDLIFRQ